MTAEKVEASAVKSSILSREIVSVRAGLFGRKHNIALYRGDLNIVPVYQGLTTSDQLRLWPSQQLSVRRTNELEHKALNKSTLKPSTKPEIMAKLVALYEPYLEKVEATANIGMFGDRLPQGPHLVDLINSDNISGNAISNYEYNSPDRITVILPDGKTTVSLREFLERNRQELLASGLITENNLDQSNSLLDIAKIEKENPALALAIIREQLLAVQQHASANGEPISAFKRLQEVALPISRYVVESRKLMPAKTGIQRVEQVVNIIAERITDTVYNGTLIGGILGLGLERGNPPEAIKFLLRDLMRVAAQKYLGIDDRNFIMHQVSNISGFAEKALGIPIIAQLLTLVPFYDYVANGVGVATDFLHQRSMTRLSFDLLVSGLDISPINTPFIDVPLMADEANRQEIEIDYVMLRIALDSMTNPSSPFYKSRNEVAEAIRGARPLHVDALEVAKYFVNELKSSVLSIDNIKLPKFIRKLLEHENVNKAVTKISESAHKQLSENEQLAYVKRLNIEELEEIVYKLSGRNDLSPFQVLRLLSARVMLEAIRIEEAS